MKAPPQDVASSSSSPSSSVIPNQVRLPRTAGIDIQEATMCAGHFDLQIINDDQLQINTIPSLCLNFHRAAEGRKGICIPPNKTFAYEPKNGHAVYICEAGLPKHQAESLQRSIQIFVQSCGEDEDDDEDVDDEDEQKIVIGSLSKEQSLLKLSLVLPAKFELSHNALRKNVYFNIFELRYRPRLSTVKTATSVYHHLMTNRDLWGAEVIPSGMSEFNPTIDGKIYKLLKVFAETASKVAIELFVDYKGIKKSLGSLSDEYPSIDCEFEFDETFQLSHSSSTSSVHFLGFTIPASFELKDLANYPLPLVEAQSPKLIVDGEYRAYQALLAKKTSGASIKPVNLVPRIATVIRAARRFG